MKKETYDSLVQAIADVLGKEFVNEIEIQNYEIRNLSKDSNQYKSTGEAMLLVKFNYDVDLFKYEKYIAQQVAKQFVDNLDEIPKKEPKPISDINIKKFNFSKKELGLDACKKKLNKYNQENND